MERGSGMSFPSMDHDSLTHLGMKRGNNQDNLSSVLAANDQQFATQGHLFLVADGMGGHLGGEKASEMASRIIPLTYTKLIGQPGATMKDSLGRAISEANDAIHRKGHEGNDFFNMGTTCSCLVIRKDGAWIGHVGDSRVYLVRDNQIHQLTFDHSMVWQAAKERGVDPDMVLDVMSNRILRCLGPERVVDADIQGPYPVHPGDAFILCSDGLSGFVADSEMAVAASMLPPAAATKYLVTLANLRGGNDNITVVVVRIAGGLEPTSREELARPELGGPKAYFPRAFWIAAATCGGLAFLVFLPLFLMGFAREFSQKALVMTLVAFMLSILAGLGKLLIEGALRNRLQSRHEAHVPVSRARNWELNGSIIENIRQQNLEIIKAAESSLTGEQLAGFKSRFGAQGDAGKQEKAAGAFGQAAANLAELAPIIEKMVRYQQIPAARLVLVKPSA